MFEQSLVEISAEMKRRKRWTQLLSYSLEAAAVLILLSFPLVHTEALPLDDSPKIFPPVYHGQPHVEVTTVHPRANPLRRDRVVINPLLPPTTIGTRIDRTPDKPQEIGDVGEVCPGCIPITGATDDRHNPILDSMLRPGPIQPVHHAEIPVIRRSDAQESLLIRKVKPIYPPLAIQTHTQGTVILHAVIGRDGSIQNLEVASGHPLLTRAALDAVRQWKYRPYLLNGEPMEVETQITVNFTLSGN